MPSKSSSSLLRCSNASNTIEMIKNKVKKGMHSIRQVIEQSLRNV
jgi:hypothetical protein